MKKRNKSNRLTATLSIIALSFSFVIIFFYMSSASAKRVKPESYYQDIYCKKKGGQTEYRLKDKSRVDCLTEKEAIEIDFASSKAYECITQALYYAAMTNRSPVCALIKKKGWEKHYNRVFLVVKRYNLPIKIEIIE